MRISEVKEGAYQVFNHKQEPQFALVPSQNIILRPVVGEKGIKGWGNPLVLDAEGKLQEFKGDVPFGKESKSIKSVEDILKNPEVVEIIKKGKAVRSNVELGSLTYNFEPSNTKPFIFEGERCFVTSFGTVQYFFDQNQKPLLAVDLDTALTYFPNQRKKGGNTIWKPKNIFETPEKPLTLQREEITIGGQTFKMDGTLDGKRKYIYIDNPQANVLMWEPKEKRLYMSDPHDRWVEVPIPPKTKPEEPKPSSVSSVPSKAIDDALLEQLMQQLQQ